MAMKIVDELETPGCPQCAIKHLAAALSYSADRNLMHFTGYIPAAEQETSSCVKVLIARAYINLGEALIGYKSHVWFAAGLLQRAEELAQQEVTERDWGNLARRARLELTREGPSDVGIGVAMRWVQGIAMRPVTMLRAHQQEAMRELPGFSWPVACEKVFVENIPALIKKIHEEYFARPSFEDQVAVGGIDIREFRFPGATVATDEGNKNQEGESDMATTKKAPAKGTKCAAKGGKTAAAKACDKGGKAATKAACKGGKTTKK